MKHSMKRQRQEGWPEALDAYVESRRELPFEWGSNDCCMFAAGAIEAMTGENPAREFVGEYRTEKKAREIIVRDGEGLAGLVTRILGEEIDPAFVKRGDVVLVPIPTEDRECVGVCLGDVWAAPGANGLIFGGVSDALTAWAV